MLAITYLLAISLLLVSSVNSKHRRFEKYQRGNNKDYDAAVRFLWENNEENRIMSKKEFVSKWKYDSNLTEENKKFMLKVGAEVAKFRLKSWKNARRFAWKDFKNRNSTIYRWFKLMSYLGPAVLPPRKLRMREQIIAEMGAIYSKAKVCRRNNPINKPCDLSLEPELTKIFIKSRNYDELKQYWNDFRRKTGKKVKHKFLKYVKLSNEGARLSGFKDYGDFWRGAYEMCCFKEVIEKLWKEIEPIYMQLHAYVRRKLIDYYSDKNILPDGPIPAHLLGNMWAQDWQSIFEIVKPFREKSMDVTKNMVKKKMRPLDMFKEAENFFVSLGLKPMTREFWNRSIIEKPKDRDIVCHASAWDFFDGKDFRIKMCTRINMADFITIHHEMGHIQYYMQYAHQPVIFRGGANPGFHEAIGDTLALSVSTPKHLRKVGLLDSKRDNSKTVINSLLWMALQKLAFLPYGYLLDSYRWKVFSGEISPDCLNTKWWELRLKYQGLCPPVRRTERDFDPGCKFHVVSDSRFMNYFVSHIIQFQFHKALCDAAGHVGPLHECDIYQNKKAGKVLSDGLRLGSSVHWSKVMSVITKGKTRKMDAQPLLEYFGPLIKWLKKQNKNEKIGWKSSDPMICPSLHRKPQVYENKFRGK